MTVRRPGYHGRDDELLTGADLASFVGDAQVLTDDHAPVDQLLTPRPTD